QIQLANSTSSYDLTVRNDGGEAIHHAHLVAALPTGLAFVLASDRGRYDSTTGSLTWDIGDLVPGESRTVIWKSPARYVANHKYRAGLRVEERLCRETALKTQGIRAPDAWPPATAKIGGNGRSAGETFAPPPGGVECATWRPSITPWSGTPPAEQ